METNLQEEYKEIKYLNESVENEDFSAILMDGQYFVSSDSSAILLPDGETQYFIQNSGDDILNYIDGNSSFDQNEVFQLVNNADENQVVYFTNDLDVLEKNEQTLMDVIEPTVKKNDTEFLDLESLFNMRPENEWVENRDTNGYQNLDSLETIPDVNFGSFLDHSYNTKECDVDIPKAMDISKITGKNLLTGQKVTLESYLEKVKNSSKELSEKTSENLRKKNEHAALSNLLNKRLTIGKTLSGQRLVGKVIHVGKKDEKDEQTVIENQLEALENDMNVLDDSFVNLSASYYGANVPNPVIVADKQSEDENILMNNMNDMLILEETQNTDTKQKMLDYVSKTMANLLKMESVLKKLKRKNLLIKVLEKEARGEEVNLNTYQFGGHLEMLGGWQKREYEEKWSFKLDFEKQGGCVDEWHRKFPETIKLTISITKEDGSIQSTKVNLNYNLEKCGLCFKGFKSSYKLKMHMKLTHNADRQSEHSEGEEGRERNGTDKELEGLKLNCSVCGDTFDRISTWREHTLRHESENRSNRTVQGRVRLNDTDLGRDGKNCYVCKVCSRTFSRYSNLQRHSEIHGTKNSMALYSCSMCGCTYNYISSLTRHIVQNHLSAT